MGKLYIKSAAGALSKDNRKLNLDQGRKKYDIAL